ncbi:MAG TPA: hypothetical protein VHU90_13535 [Galbitalea sp.]|jgi:hypothetical protein|nr:hypothetical protein [Galbitalea sp.]
MTAELDTPLRRPEKRGNVGELRERLLSVATMDLPLRIATIVTFAGLLVAAVAIATREVKAPPVSLGVVGGAQVTLSAPLFGIVLALLCCGLGYLVSAAVLSTRVVAIVGVLAFTILIGWATGVLGLGGLNAVLPAWAEWLTRGLLVTILIGTVVVLLVRGGRHGDAASDARMRLVVLCGSCALFGGYFLVLWIASPVMNGLTLFPQTVSLLMTDVAILATPLLMIASIDFGEWGKFGAESMSRLRVVRAARTGWRSRRNIVTVVLCTGAIIFGFAILRGSFVDRFWGFVAALVLTAFALAILVLGGRALRVSRFEWPRALSFAAVFSVCTIITWIIAPGAGAAIGAFALSPAPAVTTQGDYTATASVHSESGISGFTALVPLGWSFASDKVNRIDNMSNVYPSGLKVGMSGLVAPAGTTMRELDSAIHATQVGAVSRDDSWMTASVRPQGGGTGRVWIRTESSGQVRVFYGAASGPGTPTALSSFEAIVRTVRTGDEAPATLASVLAGNGGLAELDNATEHHADLIQMVAIGFELALAIVALALLAIFGRRWSATLRMAILFFAGITTITLVATVAAIGRVVGGPTTSWPALTVGGLLAASGIIGGAAVVVGLRSRAAWADRLLVALPGLLGAIIALAAVNELYDAALGAASIPAWAAILILAAAGWDIVASGEALTNLSSRTFARSTRVLAYFGYVLVLAAAMVFYSGQVSSVTGHPVTVLFFEPESTTQSALFRVGFPLLLVLFLLRVAAPSALARPAEDRDPVGPRS